MRALVSSLLMALAVHAHAASALMGSGGPAAPVTMEEIRPATLTGGTSFTVAAANTPTGVICTVIIPTLTYLLDVEVFFPGLSTTATGRVSLTTAADVTKGKCKVANSTNSYCIYQNIRLAAGTTSIYVSASDASITPIIAIQGR